MSSVWPALYVHNILLRPKYRTHFGPTLEHQASGMQMLPTFFFIHTTMYTHRVKDMPRMHIYVMQHA